MPLIVRIPRRKGRDHVGFAVPYLFSNAESIREKIPNYCVSKTSSFSLSHTRLCCNERLGESTPLFLFEMSAIDLGFLENYIESIAVPLLAQSRSSYQGDCPARKLKLLPRLGALLISVFDSCLAYTLSNLFYRHYISFNLFYRHYIPFNLFSGILFLLISFTAENLRRIKEDSHIVRPFCKHRLSCAQNAIQVHLFPLFRYMSCLILARVFFVPLQYSFQQSI